MKVVEEKIIYFILFKLGLTLTLILMEGKDEPKMVIHFRWDVFEIRILSYATSGKYMSVDLTLRVKLRN